MFAVVRDAAEDNVIYSEVRLGPRGFLGDSEFKFDEFAAGVADSLREADQVFGTITRYILRVRPETSGLITEFSEHEAN